jgi:type IV pilus assembly protein PilM
VPPSRKKTGNQQKFDFGFRKWDFKDGVLGIRRSEIPNPKWTSIGGRRRREFGFAMLLTPRKSTIFRRVRSRSTGWIGVDIGAGAVKLAQLERRDNRWHLSKTALVRWPEPGPLTLKTVENGRLAGIISQALSSCGAFRGSRAACVLSPAVCEMLTLEVPPAPEPELRDMICQELAAHREGDANDLEFDFWNAHPSVVTSEQGVVALNVLGIPRDLAESTGAELYRAGLTLRDLDGTPFTLARALSLAPGSPAAGDAPQSGAVAMLDWGHTGAMFTVVAGGQPIFARTLRNCGCAGISQAVAAALSLSDHEAWHLLSTCGVPSETGRGSTQQELQEFVAELLRGPVDEILGELNKTLDFLKQQSPDLAPQQIWLSGGGATVRNVAEHLEAGLGVIVRNWRPASESMADEYPGDRHQLPVELFANAAALSLLGTLA